MTRALRLWCGAGMDTAVDEVASGSVWYSSSSWSSVVVARHGVVKMDVLASISGRVPRGLVLNMPVAAAKYIVIAKGLVREPIPENALVVSRRKLFVAGVFLLFWPILGSFFFLRFFLWDLLLWSAWRILAFASGLTLALEGMISFGSAECAAAVRAAFSQEVATWPRNVLRKRIPASRKAEISSSV